MRKHVEESVATGVAAGRGRGGRFSAGRKREVVMRLLRGEDLESVSRAVGITAPERRSWMSASPVTSVRRQPPRTVRERPRLSARMGTGLSSATPQSSDSPTHMIQSVDASASQKRHRSCANRVAVPGSRPLARHDAARAAHAFAWHHAHRSGAAAPTSTRRQGLRGGDRAPSAQVYVDLADVERASITDVLGARNAHPWPRRVNASDVLAAQQFLRREPPSSPRGRVTRGSAC